MTGRASYWALRDANRVIRRVRHTVYAGQPLTAQEVAYVRGQVGHLLIGPLADELPDAYQACLRDLLGCLEEVAEELAEGGAS